MFLSACSTYSGTRYVLLLLFDVERIFVAFVIGVRCFYVFCLVLPTEYVFCVFALSSIILLTMHHVTQHCLRIAVSEKNT